MDHRKIKIVLLIALAAISVSLWKSWQEEHPTVSPANVATDTAQNTTVENNIPTDINDDNSAVTAKQTAAASTSSTAVTNDANDSGQIIHVHTNVLNVEIDTRGGKIIQANLPAYPETLGSTTPYPLFTNNPDNRYVAQSGLIGKNGPATKAGPVQYHTDKFQYSLQPGENKLVVPMTWINPQGVKFTKTFTFERDLYDIKMTSDIANQSSAAWSGRLFTQLSRMNTPPTSKGLFHVNAYFGASYSTPDDAYKKVSFKKMDKNNVSANGVGGWVAMQEHYFLGSWIPDQTQKNHFYSKVSPSGMYTIGTLGPKLTVQPGENYQTTAQLYAGPEIAKNLKAIAPHLEMTIDYGWLWFISVIIFWLMQQIYMIVANWGWAIVLVTVCIKLLFYKLSASSYQAMAKMRNLQPKIESLKERYGDDRQKLSQATMELYRKEKVNPLGGCLPILIQIPVFIALYWVIIESVQLRQAPWILWIHDLSIKDPYYILPIVMGLSMLLQQKLNPPPPDPTQAKVMMMLPIVFTILFLNFPAGLVLYWIVNNGLSILQQWYIMRKFNTSGPSKKKTETKNRKMTAT